MAKRIMIIDDDDRVLRIFELLIESFGYSPVPIDNPGDGLRMLSEDPPALVLLDIVMPSMDGLEFLAERRKIPGAREIPVVICSAWRLTGEELALYGDEIAEIITKPVEPARLRESLKSHLGV
ncbi:MAG: response regulator [Methanomicrobiales archaeon]|nr:response regulator [Methanomicrobiales archaeon]